MGDARLDELVAEDGEAVARVERHGMGLGVKDEARHPALRRALHQRNEDASADALPAPLAQHGHPADVTIGQEAAGPHDAATGLERERVVAARIPFVAFDLRRYALLDDKHRLADAHRADVRRGPGQDPDRDRMRHAKSAGKRPL